MSCLEQKALGDYSPSKFRRIKIFVECVCIGKKTSFNFFFQTILTFKKKIRLVFRSIGSSSFLHQSFFRRPLEKWMMEINPSAFINGHVRWIKLIEKSRTEAFFKSDVFHFYTVLFPIFKSKSPVKWDVMFKGCIGNLVGLQHNFWVSGSCTTRCLTQIRLN